jgi:hypothetical protein
MSRGLAGTLRHENGTSPEGAVLKSLNISGY